MVWVRRGLPRGLWGLPKALQSRKQMAGDGASPSGPLLSPGRTDITFGGNYSQVHYRSTSYSLAYGLARLPELRTGPM